MQEHLFSHFPDICGFACIVCRKTEKRKKNLMRHLEIAHSTDVLEMLGVGNLMVYEDHFSSNSDEQVNLRFISFCNKRVINILYLRAEVYIRIHCENCKQIFFSAERMDMHIQLGLCHAREESTKERKGSQQKTNGETLHKEKRTRLEDLNNYEDIDFYPFENLETHYSDSEDEDFTPEASQGNPSNLHYEQLSIDEDYPGLMECLGGGAPYCCVIPSCNRRTYPTITSMRRHFTTHDPEMYAYLICPICKYVRSDDHPGDMKKHVMSKHEKDEDWAKENVIIDISEKLQQFRRATAKDGSQKRKNFNTFSNRLSKVSINLEDPNIRASFTGEKGSDNFLICGVPECGKEFKSAYNLKRHYAKHDDTLRSNTYDCNICFQRLHRLDRIKMHVERIHPEVLFLLESGEEQWKLVKCERWEGFSEGENALVEESQQQPDQLYM